jgi:Plasma-membrane choline transporter
MCIAVPIVCLIEFYIFQPRTNPTIMYFFLLEFSNQWSFVYVGLYGYAYLHAGKQVAALFTARGWSVIVNDYLVSRSLAMMSMLIGLITGVMGVVVGFFFFGPLAALQTFFIGAILGMTSTNILFGVVVSAINTIVVSFAEAPDSLRVNHSPELYTELVGAWRQAYPEQFRL